MFLLSTKQNVFTTTPFCTLHCAITSPYERRNISNNTVKVSGTYTTLFYQYRDWRVATEIWECSSTI